MPEAIQPIIDESCNWLVLEQDPSGGWGERKGSHPNALNTAEVILGLLDSKPDGPPREAIGRGTDFLLRTQENQGEDVGAWMRQIHLGGTSFLEIPDIIRTCFAIQALARSRFDPEGKTAIDRGVTWLIGRQLEEGGWGFSRKSASAFMPTCLALLTLVTSCGEDVCKYGQQIEDGFEFLRSNFHNANDGSFGRYPALVAPHTIYAVMFMKAALKPAELGSYLNPQIIQPLLTKATNWLISHSEDARHVVEENFPIDPKAGIGNYRFRYMTDALLVRALEGSQDPRVGDIVESMTESIDARKAVEGGFYGDRMSTWATAKVLSGLTTAKSMPASRKKRKQNQAITLAALGFVALMVVASVFLAAIDRLGFEMFLLIIFLTMSVLLLADRVTHRDFISIVRDILHLKQPSPANS